MFFAQRIPNVPAESDDDLDASNVPLFATATGPPSERIHQVMDHTGVAKDVVASVDASVQMEEYMERANTVPDHASEYGACLFSTLKNS